MSLHTLNTTEYSETCYNFLLKNLSKYMKKVVRHKGQKRLMQRKKICQVKLKLYEIETFFQSGQLCHNFPFLSYNKNLSFCMKFLYNL